MVLYHYCSADTFLKILQSKCLWACEVSLANDSLEGRWISHLAKVYEPTKKLSVNKRTQLESWLTRLETFTAFALCLSANGDILSQWRAYAADAAGFSVGISNDFLKEFHQARKKEEGFWYFDQVEYRESEQINRVSKKFDEMKNQLEGEAFDLPFFGWLLDEKDREQKKKEAAEKLERANDALRGAVAELVPEMYLLKNPAFIEEQEWRLFKLFMEKDMPDAYREFEFASIANRIIPFKKIELPPEQNPIAEVFLGPRNRTPSHIIEGMLVHFGFKGVKVRTSIASYR